MQASRDRRAMSRLACLLTPLYPLAARLRSEPSLRDEAVAIFEGSGHAARIVAASRRARRGGVLRGMTLPQARALMPRIAVRPRDGESERAAQESLLEVAESFSPRVESAGEGVAYLDLDGLERHFPGDSPEASLGQALGIAAERAGLLCRIGIASSKLAARIAAESPDSPTIVPPGREAAFLAPLPLRRLAPEAEVMELLERWGIRSIGDFARLPANQVSSRLGSTGRSLHRKARGLDRHPIVPYRPAPAFHEGMELDWPLVSLEPFLFVARAALDRLCGRLESRGLACSRLELSMRLEPGGHHERSLQLPAPTREAKTLLTLARLDLERQPPGAPVAGFTFTAHPDRPRDAQLSLFGPAALSPDRLAATLARLFSLLGADRVGSPRTVDGYRPERCALVDYAPPPEPELRSPTAPGRGLLAVRVLRPPLPLEVILEDGETRPVEVRPAPAADGDGRQEIRGRVRVASGPWLLDESWWADDGADRAYWDVELSDGGIYRIYQDDPSGEWYADGVYD